MSVEFSPDGPLARPGELFFREGLLFSSEGDAPRVISGPANTSPSSSGTFRRASHWGLRC